MNFKTAKMMTKYRVCMTFMSILLLRFIKELTEK